LAAVHLIEARKQLPRMSSNRALLEQQFLFFSYFFSHAAGRPGKEGMKDDHQKFARHQPE
jgi:hypothetical protein